MAQATCSIEGCGRTVHARGRCSKHYQRWVKAHPREVRQRLPWPDSFLSQMDPQASGCIWLATVPNGDGYSHVQYEGRTIGGHVAALIVAGVPIPDGYVVDHQCHNISGCELTDRSCPHRRCVNVDHLRVVRPAENINASPNSNGVKTHCPKGHPYDETNTYVRPNSRKGRGCRECLREATRQWRKRNGR